MRKRLFLGLSILLFANVAQTSEWQLLHIHVNVIMITKDTGIHDADYDVKAIGTRDQITALTVYGKNTWGRVIDLVFVVDKVKGIKQDFDQTQLPGKPTSFSATIASDFNPFKGGTVRLHALTSWKLMLFKSYGYKDVDIHLDVEAGNVRASHVDKNGPKKNSKMTVNVGLTGASMKTE